MADLSPQSGRTMCSHALQRVEKWDKIPESRSDDSVLTHAP